MTTSKYLNTMLSTLPAIQARQIADLLTDLRAKGQIKNAAEYNDKLQELSVLVNSTTPRPSFSQVRALVWHLCSSDSHNTMMQAVVNDLEAIFAQVDELDIRTQDQYILLMQNLAIDLERSLNEQASTIKRLEWLANTNNEFSHALVNTFSSSSTLKVARSEFGADSLYFDNRTYVKKNQEELPSAIVDDISESLILDISNEPQILPVSATLLTDEYSYGTDISLDVNNDINNLIDGTTGTYWTRTIYLENQVEKVTTILDLNLGRSRDVNYLFVQGGAPYPFYITQIIGIGHDGHQILVYSTETEINGKARIDFDRVFVKSLQITFAVYSYDKEEYTVDATGETYNLFEDEYQYDAQAQFDAAGGLITEAVVSDSAAELLNLPTEITTQIDKHAYILVLDNIWFGDSKYIDNGIFVSKPLKMNDIGVLAVKVQEQAETGTVRNSIEYEIIKRDITPLNREFKFAIPYLNQSEVISERLILVKNEASSTINNIGRLRFVPYITPTWDFTTDSIPFTVYKNGIALSINSDWVYAIDTTTNLQNQEILNWQTEYTYAATFSNYVLSPPAMWIKILQPSTEDIYTIDYTIRTSDTYATDETLWLDIDQTISLLDGGRIFIREEDPDITVESELYLQITLRRNKPQQSSTPRLLEYAVLGAPYLYD